MNRTILTVPVQRIDGESSSSFQDLLAIEERRRINGKPPRVRFFSEEEQLEWERQYPKPLVEVRGEAHPDAGGQP